MDIARLNLGDWIEAKLAEIDMKVTDLSITSKIQAPHLYTMIGKAKRNEYKHPLARETVDKIFEGLKQLGANVNKTEIYSIAYLPEDLVAIRPSEEDGKLLPPTGFVVPQRWIDDPRLAEQFQRLLQQFAGASYQTQLEMLTLTATVTEQMRKMKEDQDGAD